MTQSSDKSDPGEIVTAKSRKLQARLLPHLDKLPIFPLYKVQLFPSAVLPLYVFEPRYRAMTADCLAHGGIMAVAALRPGHRSDYSGRPPVRRIAGVGKIVAHRQNPDGTYNILLRGLARVKITTELPAAADCPYRQVQARILPDRWPRDFDLQEARRTLIALTERLATLVPHGSEALRALCAAEVPPRRLCDVLSAALVWPPQLRRQLLELTDVPTRIDLLSGELARLIGRLGGGTTEGPN